MEEITRATVRKMTEQKFYGVLMPKGTRGYITFSYDDVKYILGSALDATSGDYFLGFNYDGVSEIEHYGVCLFGDKCRIFEFNKFSDAVLWCELEDYEGKNNDA